MSNIIVIDGSVLEGGGQIVRNTLVLSCLLNKPVKIINIRAGRSSPGLKAQHLSGIRLIAQICDATLIGAELSSTEISFFPQELKSGEFNVDIKTAGSVCLLTQVAVPCLLYGPASSDLKLKGGTNCEMAPQIDYFIDVFQFYTRKFGIDIQTNIIKRGYFPKGGGEVAIQVNNIQFLKPVNLPKRNELVKVFGRSFVAGILPIKIAHEMARTAKHIIWNNFPDIPITIDDIKENPAKAFGSGSGITLVAETSIDCKFGAGALGKKTISASKVGEQAALDLIENLKHEGCCDNYMQDQMIILMALAKGKSKIQTGPLTLHTKTAIFVIEQLTKVRFNVTENGHETVIQCEGIGLVNKHFTTKSLNSEVMEQFDVKENKAKIPKLEENENNTQNIKTINADWKVDDDNFWSS